MKRTTAVIGAAFGDEGKGLMVDYLCRLSGAEPMVVRFNGGAQAGHTVVTPDERRHVFHHFGAGTLAGARTYLSRDFLVNPILWLKEYEELQRLGLRTRLFVDREAPLTTIVDMIEGQDRERLKKHGSCGAGVYATVMRQRCPEFRLFAGDLERPVYLANRLERLRKFTDANVSDEMMQRFLDDCELMRAQINLCDSRIIIDQPGDVIFEGAQGLLLGEDHNEFFPHLTPSQPGLVNVRKIADECMIDRVNVVYVVRSYLTRHGAGPLPQEDPELAYVDTTNVENEWQGSLRFAPLNTPNQRMIARAVMSDYAFSARQDYRCAIAMTHVDQAQAGFPDLDHLRIGYRAHGPISDQVEVSDEKVV